MDFSSVDQALNSLPRRQPPLPHDTLDLSKHLHDIAQSHDRAENPEYSRGILQMIELASGNGGNKPRWEPLAVGMRLVVDYLEQRTAALPRLEDASNSAYDEDEDEGTGLGTGGGGVYAEGPRIPKIANAIDGTSVINGTSISPTSEEPAVTSPPMSTSPMFELMGALPEIVNTHVEHSEPRVRSLVAQTVGSYALYAISLLNWIGSESHSCSTTEGVLLREMIMKVQAGRREIHAAILLSLRSHLAMKEPSRENNPSAASDGALDDTTGWRALETNLHALASYIDGCVRRGGELYLNEEADLFTVDEEREDCGWFLEGLKHCCVVHVNRHVRAASAAVLGVLIKACVRSNNSQHQDLLVEEDSSFRAVLSDSLRSTLADNWSQVRMAGSVLCRRLVRGLLRIHHRNEVDSTEDEDMTAFEFAAGDLVPMLLPRMCLNRFYLAQGVKLYSQDTWKLVFGAQNATDEWLSSSDDTKCSGGGGLGAVARNATPLCRYYAKMCDADNHAVREAACQAVAELAQKVGNHPLYAEYLAPHVTVLLQALLMCFHDESWPVRDEACLACGTFCLAYSEECKPELPTLFERWTEQLTDQIWSVREDAAIAIGDAIVAYGPDMLEKILSIVRKKLPSARDQPSMTREEYRKLQNDVSTHTGNQLYSCGSLAPKLRKGGAGRIGCGDCAISRPKSPWEATDGCIYLLRELCVRFPSRDNTARDDIVLNDSVLLPLMTELADVCRFSHYPQSDDLRTTLWRQLPPIAQAMGRRRFKGLYLDLFIELLAKNLDDQYGIGTSQLCIHAAGQCAEELANLIGVGIFRGRLAETGRQEAFDRIMDERKRDQMASHAAARSQFLGSQTFSPFGPPGIALAR